MGGVDYTKSKTHTSYADPPKRMVLGRFYLDENGYGYRPGRKKMVYEQGEKAAPGGDVAEYCAGIDPKSLGGVKMS